MRRPIAALLCALIGCGGDVDAPSPPAEGDAGQAAPSQGASLTVTALSPERVSARGGELLTIEGDGFREPVTVRIGALPAAVALVQPVRLVVQVPRTVAGPKDLGVTVGDGPELVVPDAVAVDPLPLTYVPALTELASAPECDVVTAAVAFDADADGDPDIVVGCDDGLRVLTSSAGELSLLREVGAGGGEDAAPARPFGRGEVRGLVVADLDGDELPELVVCTGAGRELVLVGSPAGLAPGLDTPWRSEGCLAVAPIRADRTAAGLAVLAREGAEAPGLFVLRAATGRLEFAPTEGEPIERTPIGQAASADPGAALLFERAPASGADGEGAGRLEVELTEAGPDAVFTVQASLAVVPDAVRLGVSGEQLTAPLDVRARLVDSQGQVFESAAAPIPEAGWHELALDGPWTPLIADQEPAPPISSVALRLTADSLPASGVVWIDSVRAETDGHMAQLIEDFEVRAPQAVPAGAAGLVAAHLDGDELGDLVVLPGGGKPGGLLLSAAVGAGAEPGRWFSTPLPATGPGPFPAGVAFDADGDGDSDLILVSAAAQDRLLVGDGWGAFLDATPGAMPLDHSPAGAVQAADVDLDGAMDVVIGNRGSTDRLYRGLGDGRFADATPSLGFDTVDTVALVLVDLDLDGDNEVVSLPADGHEAPLVRVAVEVSP